MTDAVLYDVPTLKNNFENQTLFMFSKSPVNKKTILRWFRIAFAVRLIAIVFFTYLLIAYLLLPLDWFQYERRHPAIDSAPDVTHTTLGIPGDPINVGLVGTEHQIQSALLAAKWFPADPITLKSSLKIATDTILKRSYHDAPVSSLYLWGRKQDLAFEQPVADDPRRRHHVRLWKSEKLDSHDNPIWFGAATYDTNVGLSHTTGEVTHHIAPDIDAERDKLIDDLLRVLQLTNMYWVDGFHKILQGKNGGGDHYQTDGRLRVGVLVNSSENK